MRNINNYQIILFLCLMLFLPLNLKAQKKTPLKRNSISAQNSIKQFEENALSQLKLSKNQEKLFKQHNYTPTTVNLFTEKDISKQHALYNSNILLSLNKPQSSTLLLEKVIYTADQTTWIESFT